MWIGGSFRQDPLPLQFQRLSLATGSSRNSSILQLLRVGLFLVLPIRNLVFH